MVAVYPDFMPSDPPDVPPELKRQLRDFEARWFQDNPTRREKRQLQRDGNVIKFPAKDEAK